MATTGSRWFRRLVKECKQISPHIRIKRIKYGFYRIYYQRAYIHEVFQEMPQHGHDIEEKNMQLESNKYVEEYEDRIELIRKIKNYKEGYWDARDTILTRVYLMRHDKEFNKTSTERYQTVVIK